MHTHMHIHTHIHTYTHTHMHTHTHASAKHVHSHSLSLNVSGLPSLSQLMVSQVNLVLLKSLTVLPAFKYGPVSAVPCVLLTTTLKMVSFEM